MQYISKAIADLEAYRVEPPKYEIILNANENPWDFPQDLKKELFEQLTATPFNRYPDAALTDLRAALADYLGVEVNQIMAGCGSDEIIDMLFQAFTDPGDVIITHSPSFSMYGIWGQINSVNAVTIPDNDDGRPDVEAMIAAAQKQNAKMLFICNPNNPTGYLFPKADIIRIIEETDGLVILDEAYIEFTAESSLVRLIDRYPNLIILRTLSKAFGLAGIRCGYCAAQAELIDVLFKVKSPYNLNVLTQTTALLAMNHREQLLQNVGVLNQEREKMIAALKALPISKVYPTAANFIYFKTEKAQALYNHLLANDVLIRAYGSNSNSIRLTVGSPAENEKVIELIKEVFDHA